MSIQFELPGLFNPGHQPPNSEQTQAPSARQLAYARDLATRTGRAIPNAVVHDKAELSAWINRAKPERPGNRFSAYPSARQVAFAERIARIKRRDIPAECFHDRVMMSRWIDGNKPR